MNFISICGINVSKTTRREVVEFVAERLSKKRKFIIFTPNPEILVIASKKTEYKKVLNTADVAIPDGIGLKLADPSLKTIKGREVMTDLFDLADQKKLKIFLLGSTDKVNNKSLKILSEKFKNVRAKGASGPWLHENGAPASEQDKSREIDVIKKINAFKPDMLFIAFGAPKQEIWVNKFISNPPTRRASLQVGGVMVVGGSLDYFSGKAKLPPAFVANLGLEWLWRLVREPSRAGRIFNAVVVFPLLVLLTSFSHQSQKS